MQQYELLALGDQEVTLFDPAFPLFHQAYPRQEFFDLLKENPLNDKYLQEVEVVPEATEPSISAAPDVPSNGAAPPDEDEQLLNGVPSYVEGDHFILHDDTEEKEIFIVGLSKQVIFYQLAADPTQDLRIDRDQFEQMIRDGFIYGQRQETEME